MGIDFKTVIGMEWKEKRRVEIILVKPEGLDLAERKDKP